MPLFWKMILKNFGKIFIISIGSFCSLLLLTRLKDIAKYAALASSIQDVFYFALIQIPHILPFAIPLSCFIASFMVFRSLSVSRELTAFRSAALSLSQIFQPLIVLSIFLSFLNFFIASELTSRLRFKSQDFLIDKTSTNPVSLLKKQKLLKIKDSYVNFKKELENSLEDVIFITLHPSSKKLLLFTAKKLQFTKTSLKGLHSTLLSTLKAKGSYDHLIIENQEYFSSPGAEIANFMKKKKRKMLPSFIPIKMLRLQKAQDEKTQNVFAQEVCRRFSFGVFTFIFTFVGLTFGVQIHVTRQKKSLFYALLCILIMLTMYLVAKHVKGYPLLSMLFYIAPSLIVLIFCLVSLRKISKGVI